MARKIALTPACIDALKKGSLSDLLSPGLAIEVLGSGKKRWRYRRQVAGTKIVATMFGGVFPGQSIADARQWARGPNEAAEAGIDPREAVREAKARAEMAVARAHKLYMVAVREGRSSRAKRPNKPRTISDKLEIYERDIAPKLASRSIYEVTEADLIKLVEAKGKKPRRYGLISSQPSSRCSSAGPRRCAASKSGWKAIPRGDLEISSFRKPGGHAS